MINTISNQPIASYLNLEQNLTQALTQKNVRQLAVLALVCAVSFYILHRIFSSKAEEDVDIEFKSIHQTDEARRTKLIHKSWKADKTAKTDLEKALKKYNKVELIFNQMEEPNAMDLHMYSMALSKLGRVEEAKEKLQEAWKMQDPKMELILEKTMERWGMVPNA